MQVFIIWWLHHHGLLIFAKFVYFSFFCLKFAHHCSCRSDQLLSCRAWRAAGSWVGGGLVSWWLQDNTGGPMPGAVACGHVDCLAYARNWLREESQISSADGPVSYVDIRWTQWGERARLLGAVVGKRQSTGQLSDSGRWVKTEWW